jgi:Putative peptidoglycan binding domain
MKPYVIRQGDYLTKLAHTMGFNADSVWNDDKNKDLKDKRQDPNQLQPGDILQVPDEPKARLPIIVGSTNNYVARIPKVPVVLRLQIGGEILVKEPFVIHGVGKKPIEGATDEHGYLSTEVPVHVRELEVELTERNRTLRVRVGNMDPMNELSGLQKRLTHLGFYQPSYAGTENYEACDPKQIMAALAAFQSSKKLPATGRLDDDTAKALVDAHGS